MLYTNAWNFYLKPVLEDDAFMLMTSANANYQKRMYIPTV